MAIPARPHGVLIRKLPDDKLEVNELGPNIKINAAGKEQLTYHSISPLIHHFYQAKF